MSLYKSSNLNNSLGPSRLRRKSESDQQVYSSEVKSRLSCHQCKTQAQTVSAAGECEQKSEIDVAWWLRFRIQKHSSADALHIRWVRETSQPRDVDVSQIFVIREKVREFEFYSHTLHEWSSSTNYFISMYFLYICMCLYILHVSIYQSINIKGLNFHNVLWGGKHFAIFWFNMSAFNRTIHMDCSAGRKLI